MIINQKGVFIMNNVIELSPEKITELFKELKAVLDRASLSNEDELFTCWEDFKKAYSVLDDLNCEQKLSEGEERLLSDLKYKFVSIIEDKQEEIHKLIDINLEEGKNLHGEEFKENHRQWVEYNKKIDKLFDLQSEIRHYDFEVMKTRHNNITKDLEQLQTRLEEKRENSHKILANQEDYTDEQIQKAKEFLLLFFGEEK